MAYKHSLNLTGTPTNKIFFTNRLKELGYVSGSSYNPSNLSRYLVVNAPSNSHSLSTMNGQFNDLRDPLTRDFEFNIDNLWEFDAALAIAAIHDDNEPHIGEWVVAGGGGQDVTVLGEKGTLHKIDALAGDGNFSVEDYRSKRADNRVTSLDYDSKATPEEIISHFKAKYMNASGTAITAAIISSNVTNGVATPRKIIGYKAPFSLRDGEIPPGTIYKPRSGKYYSAEDIKGQVCILEKEIVEKWEAVYDEEEVKLTIGNRGAIITIGRGKIRAGGNVILHSTLSAIYNKLVAATGDEIGGWELHIIDDLRFIRIGCKDEDNRVSLKEIRDVISAYEKLNK